MEFHLVELFAEAPVAESRRHAVRPECINNLSRANFVSHRVEIKAESLRNVGYFLNCPL